MIEVELTDPHHVTAGFTGEPGMRAFYVQAEDDRGRITLALEKEQVLGLAELLAQLLARINDEPASDWDRGAMALREPVEAQWRVGAIQVGLDPDRGRFVLEFVELPSGDEEDAGSIDDEEEQLREVRVWANQDQARRLAAHGAEVVTQGRPRCALCGRPTEPDGSHVCPATNGHGRLSR